MIQQGLWQNFFILSGRKAMHKIDKKTDISINKTYDRATNAEKIKAFPGQVARDIEQLNRLITEFNQTTETKYKKEVLLEIYHYYKKINDKYPDDIVAASKGFIDIFQVNMFQEIQTAFKDLGQNSLTESAINAFDLQNDSAISWLEIQENSDNYPSAIQKLIQAASNKTGKEKVQALALLKATIRADIIDLKSGRILLRDEKTRRELIFAINGELNRLNPIQDQRESPEKLSFPDKNPRAKPNLLQKYLARFITNTPSAQSIQIAEDSPPKIPEFLASMAPDKVAELAKILTESRDLTADLNRLYNKDDKGYKEFQEILRANRIEYLGGGNSSNFKITNNLTSQNSVLKVENRMAMPKTKSRLLTDYLLPERFTKTFAERPTSFNLGTQTVSRTISINEYCAGGDLLSHSQAQKQSGFWRYLTNRVTPAEIQARNKAATHIYLQMTETLATMQKNGILFPDMKNTNWLMDTSGALRIADTKSFLPITKLPPTNEKPQQKDSNDVWYGNGIILSDSVAPPYFGRETVDQTHAFMLGKNLYQYLTGCSEFYLFQKTNHEDLDFSHAVFKGATGKKFREIIEKTVIPRTSSRQKLAEVATQLTTIQMMMECQQLVDEIAKQGFGSQDKHMKAFVKETKLKIEKSTGIKELTELKNELNAIEKSELVRHIKTGIQDARKSAKWLDLRTKAETQKIEKAMGVIPINQRSDKEALSAVEDALKAINVTHHFKEALAQLPSRQETTVEANETPKNH